MSDMSDIPVGSPPAPPGRHAAPGGWYPDPLDVSRERYWDGWQWSRNTRESDVPAAYRQPSAAPGQPPSRPYETGSATAYPVTPGPRPAVLTADGVPVASWGWRLLAGLVDGLVVGVVGLLVSLPLYRGFLSAVQEWWQESLRLAQTGGQPPLPPNLAATVSGPDQVLITLVALAVGLAYHILLLRLRGATLGLGLCGLRVVPVGEGRSTARLGWARLCLRSLVWLVPWNVPGMFFVTLADVLVPLWHPRRQTLHDLVARTQVVKTR